MQVTKLKLDQNAPAILSGVAMAGVAATTYLAARGGMKAQRILDEAQVGKLREQLNNDEVDGNYDIKNIDKFKMTWSCYLPAALMGATTIACIFGAQKINTERLAAMAGAYAISKDSLKEYKEKVKEMFGEEKAEEVHEEIVQNHLDLNPVSRNEVIVTERGNDLCYDSYSGRYFKGDVNSILSAQNQVNNDLYSSGGFIPLNTLYYYLGLPEIKLGDENGWTTDALLELKVSSKLAENGVPCVVLEYITEPKHDAYRSF